MRDTAAEIENEDAVVARAVAGSRDAFHELYLRHSSAVFGFLRNRVGFQRAEDLTAETFCRAYEHLSGYECRGAPFRAWLLRIAYNLVVGESRRRSSTDVITDDPAKTVVVDGHEERVIAGSESERLRTSMALLSREHQMVLDLRYFRELSVAETATVLGLKEEAVRSLAYRAMKALRKAHGA